MQVNWSHKLIGRVADAFKRGSPDTAQGTWFLQANASVTGEVKGGFENIFTVTKKKNKENHIGKLFK